MKKLADMKKSELIEVITEKTEENGEMQKKLDQVLSQAREVAGERDSLMERINDMLQSAEISIDTMAEILDHARDVIHWDPDSDRSFECHEAAIDRFQTRMEMCRRTFGVHISPDTPPGSDDAAHYSILTLQPNRS